MRTSSEVYRELETTSRLIGEAKHMGEEVGYIYALTIKRDELRNEYNLISSAPGPETSGQG